MQSKNLDMRGKREPLTARPTPTAASRAADAELRKKKRAAAVSEYEKAQKAVKEKVDRLRALRLARDEAERAEAELAAAELASKKRPSKKKK